MAELTEQEVDDVKKLLQAYKNGKRTTDLPEASGSMDDLTIRVVDRSGEDKQIGLASAVSIVNKKIAVRRWDETLATPVGEAYGNIDFLRELPSVLGLGCYLVTDDRKRRKLDPTDHYKFADGSPARLDGSMGQYMWCWNEHYFGFWKEGNYYYEAVSLTPIEGHECYRIPAGGTSALGNGVVDRTNLLLCSVINDGPQYRGGANQIDWDGTHRTQLGKPATSISYGNFSVYARKRGEGWESQWYVSRAVQEYLFRIIMGTRNSQAEYIAEKDANGLYRGGLGVGLTNVNPSKWNAYNGYYPLLPTYTGVELGDAVGVAECAIPFENGSLFHDAKIPVFFGLKNLYGNLWTAVRGLVVEVTDKKSSVYVAPSLYENYNNNSIEGMIKVAETFREGSYIKKISMHKLCCIPTEGNATSSTYYSDYHYCNHNASGWPYLRGRMVGGSAQCAANAGAFSTYTSHEPWTAGEEVSGALCYFTEDPIMY